MKAKLKTDFVVFHCMVHKLELAITDVIKLVTEVGHLQSFIDALYAHFSRSPKNQNQLSSGSLCASSDSMQNIRHLVGCIILQKCICHYHLGELSGAGKSFPVLQHRYN